MRLWVMLLACSTGLHTVSAQTLLYTSAYSGALPSAYYGYIPSDEDGLLDFDSDGFVDILTSMEERVPGQAELFGILISGVSGDSLATITALDRDPYSGGPLDSRAMPDITGDGVPDLWVLIPDPDTETRALALVSGAAVLSGSSTPVVTLLPGRGAQPGSTSGYNEDLLATGFDATGDGVPDMLALEQNTVRLYDGANIAAGGQSFLLRYDPPDRDFYSLSDTRITFVPDLAGDGRADVVIADPGVFNPPADGFGRVYVFDGASGGLIRTLIAPFGSTAFGAEGVVAIGGAEGPGAGADLDGDGVADLVVSGRGDVKGGTTTPELYVYSGASGDLLALYRSPECESFGRNLRAVPDTDGDGAADLAYAVRRSCPGETYDPSLVVVSSSATGAELFRVEDPAVLPNDGKVSRSGFGEHLLGSLGDADGDGLWDLVVSAPNAGGVGFTPGPGLIYAFTRAPVAAEPSAEAERLALSASPNPSRGASRLSFTLPSAQRVRLSLHDALGREVAVLADGARSAGPHRVASAPRLAPGVYVARLVADGVVATRTVSVVR